MYYTEENIFHSVGRSNYRIPTIVTTKRGTVLAFCNDRHDTCIDHAPESAVSLCRKEIGGEWSKVMDVAYAPGWGNMIGSAVYDHETDTVFLTVSRSPVSIDEFGGYTEEERAAFAEEAQKRAKRCGLSLGKYMLVSTDDGKTWTECPFVCEPVRITDTDGNERSFSCLTHGSGPGIQLHRGPRAGRLLCPSRFMTGYYTSIEGLQLYGFNNAIYSDDHGMTWKASSPVQPGTGEGTLIECGDGTILYNSRAFYHDQKRYLATSFDSGETFGDFRKDDFLIEEKGSGCNACLLRVEREDLKNAFLLPKDAVSVTLFSNPRAEIRCNFTICVSFDDGKTWSHTKLVRKGLASYSALTYSPKSGHFYMLYELGDMNPCEFGLNVAEFDLEWLMST